MLPTSPFGMLGVSLLIGAISIGLRFWFYYAGLRAFRGTGSQAGDSYLSFDERLAEKLREIEPRKDPPGESLTASSSADDSTYVTSAQPEAPLPPRGFGRRIV